MDRNIINEPFWTLGVEESYRILRTNFSGLEEKEIEIRQNLFGKNEIHEERRFIGFKIFLSQFRSPLIFILVAAGIITVFLKEWLDAVVIFAAVVMNTALGFYQENKAENVLAVLKSYIRIKTRVRRAGKDREIDASSLVPGDIIHLSLGDRVPADARIIFSNSLEADESILTGESMPVSKNEEALPAYTVLSNRVSMLFSGTLIVQGVGEAVVTATGLDTEFGKIARLIAREEKTVTPLERSLSQFTKFFGIIFGVLVLFLFAVGIYKGEDFFEMFFVAVAIAVSAVPEGLPIAFTVVLAIGVERLARKKTIVKKLVAAETLGSTTLILTDKTGTLTQAAMTLTAVLPFKGSLSVERERHLLEEAVRNVDVIIENPIDVPAEWRVFGPALEVALVRGAALRGVFAPSVLGEINIIQRMPFNSVNRFSLSVSDAGETRHVALFGAPEAIIPYTNFSPEEFSALKEEVDRRANEGEKVLAVATAQYQKNKSQLIQISDLKGFSFLGLLLFRDPPRPHVRDAIRRIHAQGVRTVILTGDHLGTAQAIARELNIMEEGATGLEGDELLHFSEEELNARSREVSVYARVTPEQKVMITKLYQKQGEVVAMIGDGVNDAPALEAADIGVAVDSGTDVAKSAADIVMLEDNFEILVAAIDEGRRIFSNMRKVAVYLLSDSLNALLLIGGSLLLGFAMPLNALQILFVNFFSDSFPAVALAFEKNADADSEKSLRGSGLFDKEVRFLILVIGLLLSGFLFLLYAALLAYGFPGDHVRTFIFGSFSAGTLLLIFSVRSLERSIFEFNPFSNGYINIGVCIGIIFTLIAMYVPFFQKIFDTIPLSPLWLFGILGVGIINIGAVEAGKWFFRMRRGA